MKREFGTKLIEDFSTYQDLRLVADTSGAYIPGHGTPTVIVVGRNESAIGSTIRAVLGIRGEPGRPDDPAKSFVWTSIIEHIDDPGWDDSWITVTDLDRTLLETHPVPPQRRWCSPANSADRLGTTPRLESVWLIGIRSTNADSAIMADRPAFRRVRLKHDTLRQLSVANWFGP